MNRSDGSGAVSSLADERQWVLDAVEDLDGVVLTGPVIFRRMHERSTDAEAGARPEAGPNPGDQSLLYPALHSLEADWRVQARWLPDANGIWHRTYRKRRLLPRQHGSPEHVRFR
jgi:hypothetical protein